MTIEGRGWVEASPLHLKAAEKALPLRWIDASTWTVNLPVVAGTNEVELVAMGQRQVVRGSDRITVTGTGCIEPAGADNIAGSGLHHHPDAPRDEDRAAGFTWENELEFIELQNISRTHAVNLTGSRFDTGTTHVFASGTLLPPDGRLAAPRRAAALALRHPDIAFGSEYFHEFDPTGHRFGNGGQRITLTTACTRVLRSFVYDDTAPWRWELDGGGARWSGSPPRRILITTIR